jgi:hypothetical protein
MAVLLDISYSGNACDEVSIAGSNRIWFGIRSDFGRDWYLQETATGSYGEIIGHSGVDNIWFALYPIRETPNVNSQVQREPSVVHDITLEFAFPLVGSPVEDAYFGYLRQADCIFAVQDKNGRCMLIGENSGCKITADVSLADGLANIAANCQQRWPIRYFSEAYFETFIKPIS